MRTLVLNYYTIILVPIRINLLFPPNFNQIKQGNYHLY